MRIYFLASRSARLAIGTSGICIKILAPVTQEGHFTALTKEKQLFMELFLMAHKNAELTVSQVGINFWTR